MQEVCVVCGRPLVSRKGQRGRPARYCAAPEGAEKSVCARIDARVSEVATMARQLADTVAGEHDGPLYLQSIKSYLWREVNSATNRGKLAGRANRAPYTKTRSGWWRARKPVTPEASSEVSS